MSLNAGRWPLGICVLVGASALVGAQEGAGADAAAADEAAKVAGAADLTPEGVEALVEASGPWFERFGDWIRAGADVESLGPNIAWSAPSEADDQWVERPSSLLVIRSYDVAAKAIDSEKWRRRFIRGRVVGSELEVSTKIVGARSLPDGGAACEVRIEVTGARQFNLPPVWQSVAHAEVTLRPGGTAGGDPWQAAAISLTSFERAQVDEPFLAERTAGVFERTQDLATILGVGMDRWATRLDDGALSAWFGHQGLAAGDINGDGLSDLYVAMPSGMPNMLLVQQPDGRVVDAAKEYGVAWLDDTKGVLLLDIDSDGDDDVVSALGHVIAVQENTGEGELSMRGWCSAPDEASFYTIAASDLNSDGELEIYGTRYVTTRYADAIPIPFEDARNGPSNHLFQFKGGKYIDATAAWGLKEEGGRFSLGASFVDADGDGDFDLYVVNDFGGNQLFRHTRGKFTEWTQTSGLEDLGAGMGASWADYDLDGRIDVYVTNMYSSAGRRIAYRDGFAEGQDADRVEGIRRLTAGNSLYRGVEGGKFERVEGTRTEMGRWGWGGIFTDLDSDGEQDLVVPAGFLTGPKPGDL